MPQQRTEPPLVAGERETLDGWLDFHRATLAMKCEGLSDDQLRERAAPPSSLSLLGLVRHMADVERGWFRRGVGGEDAPPLFVYDADPDGDFGNVDTADIEEAFAAWRGECDRAREIMAARDSLDATVAGGATTYSMRWIVTHMIEEYARHNGHADLLRERIDGSVGD